MSKYTAARNNYFKYFYGRHIQHFEETDDGTVTKKLNEASRKSRENIEALEREQSKNNSTQDIEIEL